MGWPYGKPKRRRLYAYEIAQGSRALSGYLGASAAYMLAPQIANYAADQIWFAVERPIETRVHMATNVLLEWQVVRDVEGYSRR